MYNVIVPVFFCTMGMLVDWGAMQSALVFGLVFSWFGGWTYFADSLVGAVVGAALPTSVILLYRWLSRPKLLRKAAASAGTSFKRLLSGT